MKSGLHRFPPVLFEGFSVGILVSHPQHSLIGHHPILVLAQENDICSVVVGTGRLMHLHNISMQALEKKQNCTPLGMNTDTVLVEPSFPAI